MDWSRVMRTPKTLLFKNRALAAYVACLRKKLMARFQQGRYRQLPTRLLHLAVTEAEALAWTTPEPLLVFPALAEEKVESLFHWAHRQSRLMLNKVWPSDVSEKPHRREKGPFASVRRFRPVPFPGNLGRFC
jgi:hypothetical protein